MICNLRLRQILRECQANGRLDAEFCAAIDYLVRSVIHEHMCRSRLIEIEDYVGEVVLHIWQRLPHMDSGATGNPVSYVMGAAVRAYARRARIDKERFRSLQRYCLQGNQRHVDI